MSADTRDVWAILESPPKGCEETAQLYSWSLNYDSGKGPFTLLLDLLGWSEENLGEPLYSLKDASLGYMELDYLADALKEYTADPHGVREFVDLLMTAESGE